MGTPEECPDGAQQGGGARRDDDRDDNDHCDNSDDGDNNDNNDNSGDRQERAGGKR
jgi:hypothetical protein